MRPVLLAFAVAILCGATLPAAAQKERVIKFGRLNNADHPVSLGVKRFAEILAAKSGGKMRVQEYRPRRWATNCSSNRRCREACRR